MKGQRVINVLLVEDSSSDALLLEAALSKATLASFSVASVETLAECLDRLQGLLADIILLDLNLPDSDGITTFLKTQSEAGRVPIVVLTGLDDSSIASQSLHYGAEDYIVKGSFDSDSLIRSLLFAIERKRGQAHLDIQLTVAKALSESESVDETIAKVLAAIREWLHWDSGAFWSTSNDTETARCKSFCAKAAAQTEDLSTMSLETTLKKGEGLPGLVWALGKAVFVPNLENDKSFTRALAAEKSGMKAALAFPATVGDKTLGVLEFFSHKIHTVENEELLKAFEVIGSQIGQFLARKQAQQAQLEMAAIVSSCEEAIIGKNLNGVISSWNSAAERLYGYPAHEVIGQPDSILAPTRLREELTGILQKLKGGEKLENYETVGLRKGGERIHLAITTSPVIDSMGQIVGISTITRDITQKKVVQEALQDTRERLELAIGAARIGLWDWNLIDGRVRWDTKMYELFGLNEDEFVPTFEVFMQCVHPDDRTRVGETLEAAIMASSDCDFDYRVVFPDNTVRYILTKGKVVSGETAKSQRMTGACIDITGLKSAEIALFESEQRLRLALDSAKMAVWDLDMLTNSVWRSPNHDEIFGYASHQAEWNHQTFLRHIVPEDLALVEKKHEIALTSGRISMQFRIIHNLDQSVRWLSVHGEAYKNKHGKPVRMVGTVWEITEAKRLEQQAHEARKQRDQILAAIVKHAPIGIVILNSDLKVTNANAAFVSMINRPLEQLVNQALAAVLPSAVFGVAGESMNGDQPFQASRLPVAIPTQSGESQRYWDLSLWPVVNEEMQLIGAVLQIVDCTDTVLLEQQRDDFVASVAHDIKNPLVGAQRIFDTLCSQSYIAAPETHTAMLSVLRDSNQNLLSLLQNLVDVYRYETLAYPCQYEDIHLNSLIESCIKQIANFAEGHDVTVQFEASELDFLIQADSIGLRRVLMNLLHNAIKFGKKGGKVAIIVEKLLDTVKLRVNDTGIGISESDKRKLFQRFYQGSAGKAQAGGTGLGLYLCKQIVEAHRGTITCESTSAVGTSFIVTLPINQPVSL